MLMFLLIPIPLLVGGYWTEDSNLGAAAKYPKDLVCVEIGKYNKIQTKTTTYPKIQLVFTSVISKKQKDKLHKCRHF